MALRFRGRATVRGIVLASDGALPVADVAVNLFPDPASREKGRGTVTGSDGRFEFFGVPLGIFSLQAQAPDGTARALSETLTQAGEEWAAGCCRKEYCSGWNPWLHPAAPQWAIHRKPTSSLFSILAVSMRN